jgi:serine/threonine protein kinase
VIQAETTDYPDPIVSQEASRLFLREMKVITTLDHPHILPVFDFGETKYNKSTIMYMVMPLRMEGTLNDWLQAGNTIYLYVNQQFLTRINDNAYSQGPIGIAAESYGNPTEIAFSNAKVWTL